VKEFQDNPQNISVLHVGVALREPYGLKKGNSSTWSFVLISEQAIN